MGRGWKRWRGEREVEGWKRGVCVWNQVAGSCILSGVAGHTLPHCHFTAMQCIGIIRLELQAIKYPSSALWARVYNFSKSFSYAGLKGSQHLAMQDLHSRADLCCLHCNVSEKCDTNVSEVRSVLQCEVCSVLLQCAVCISVLCAVCSVGASSVTRCRWSGDTVGVMGHSRATSPPLTLSSISSPIITNLKNHLCIFAQSDLFSLLQTVLLRAV